MRLLSLTQGRAQRPALRALAPLGQQQTAKPAVMVPSVGKAATVPMLWVQAGLRLQDHRLKAREVRLTQRTFDSATLQHQRQGH